MVPGRKQYLISAGDSSQPGLGLGLCPRINADSPQEAVARFRRLFGNGCFEVSLDYLFEERSEGEYLALFIQPEEFGVEQITAGETEPA